MKITKPAASSMQWLHNNHWDSGEELDFDTAGVAGEQNLGSAVATGKTRLITEIVVRHTGTNNTVVTLFIGSGVDLMSFDVPAQTTRVYTSVNGIKFTAGQLSAIRVSDITGGDTYVSASGVEA